MILKSIQLNCKYNEIIKVSKSELSEQEEINQAYEKLINNKLGGKFSIQLNFEDKNGKSKQCIADCFNLKWSE